ncbi:hypothetical protein A2625_06210 [candidate division WOR-1 bacterium RIFCSPHIGHO2_01_FULL_53_15]|uniref:Uncharacterized protein n=1 Tax=candidate division WOR-1 bacterium RIFCSPHIGHO2_01_FULL_53_15 TaxID=1802564 RepID=A0A1F4Q1A1_UNCSA|nr:MAG: hypothetical protein A2625_06210 [candidate division WOR-1 bacterium RIFCSPHIGHO2_01_FULL_53_15]OGC13820.1 MAG: hypothetical protein A3D23_02010 [candidate division WOR-1 bacterium RIFCSPHIGHO2_02_FULL_53_26]
MIERIRHGRPLREVITRKSQLNLEFVASFRPTEARAFLKNILRLDHLAIPIERIAIPQNLGKFENLDVLQELGRTRFVVALMDRAGGLDARQAGLRNKPGYRDLTPKYQFHSPADLELMLADASAAARLLDGRLEKGSGTNNSPLKLEPASGRPGAWQIRQKVYRRTASGEIREEIEGRRVATGRITAMLRHEIESIEEEIEKNIGFLLALSKAAAAPAEVHWDELFDLYLEFTGFLVPRKRKAAIEIEWALQLLPVGTDDALRQAGYLLRQAVEDIGLRQRDLLVQKDRITFLKTEAGQRISGELRKFAEETCSALASHDVLTEPERLRKIYRNLGIFLGTFLRGEMREPWLQRAKSRVYGLKKILPAMIVIVNERNAMIDNVNKLRIQYQAWWREAAAGPGSAAAIEARIAKKEGEVLSSVKEALELLRELSDRLIGGLRKGGEHILRLENDLTFGAEGKRMSAEIMDVVLHDKLARFDRLKDYVSAWGKKGEPLGRALRVDALKMGLIFKASGGGKS